MSSLEGNLFEYASFSKRIGAAIVGKRQT